MNDTTRRFLNAIVERVPSGGRIVELRLFPAMRQGGMESGVAVVAVEPPEPVIEPVPELLGANLDGSAIDTIDPHSVAAHELVDTDVTSDEEEGAPGDGADESGPTFVPVADTSDESDVGDALDDEMNRIVVEAERELMAPEPPPIETEEESPYADAPPPVETTLREIPGDEPDAPPADDVVLETVLDADLASPTYPVDAPPNETPPPIHRYAILTARYRLTLKGADRGKWEVEVTHEADAPLATVARVARGVAKRAGEDSDPEHFSAESLREALDAPAWLTTT